eukprot:scaffold73411_cov31-Tisochrysis_lutea.AAC.5
MPPLFSLALIESYICVGEESLPRWLARSTRTRRSGRNSRVLLLLDSRHTTQGDTFYRTSNPSTTAHTTDLGGKWIEPHK